MISTVIPVYRLLELLCKNPHFIKLKGIDLNKANLEISRNYINSKVELEQGSFEKLKDNLGYEAITLVEVIEHIKPSDLPSVEKKLFDEYRPKVTIVTTPLSDPSVVGGVRTRKEQNKLGHYFEWTIEEGRSWAERISNRYSYKLEIKDIRISPKQRGSMMITFSLS